MTDDATCARCDSPIMPGHGYAVYSEASEGVAADHRVFFTAPGPAGMEKGDIECKQLDAMLYCEECADALFTEKIWKDAKALRVDIAPEDVDGVEGKEARFEVIDFSIALRAKRDGLTPSEARRDAHTLGQRWWKDQNATKLQLAEDSRLNGLEGWLSLVGLALVVSPIVLIYGLWNDLRFMTGPNYNAVGLIIPDLPGFTVFDFITGVLLLAGLVYLNILFFKKKKIFPKYFMVLLIVSFAVNLLKYWARPSGAEFGQNWEQWEQASRAVEEIGNDLAFAVSRSFIAGIVWVSYFRRSRRVKATFVR